MQKSNLIAGVKQLNTPEKVGATIERASRLTVGGKLQENGKSVESYQ